MKQSSHQNNWKLQAAVISTCIMQGIAGFVLEARRIFSELGWVDFSTTGSVSANTVICFFTFTTWFSSDNASVKWGVCRASCLSSSALTPEPLQLFWGGGWCMAGEQSEAVTASLNICRCSPQIEWNDEPCIFLGLPSGSSVCVGQVQGITSRTQCKKKYYHDLKGWHQMARSLETLLCLLIAIVNIYTVSSWIKEEERKKETLMMQFQQPYNILCIHQHTISMCNNIFSFAY